MFTSFFTKIYSIHKEKVSRKHTSMNRILKKFMRLAYETLLFTCWLSWISYQNHKSRQSHKYFFFLHPIFIFLLSYLFLSREEVKINLEQFFLFKNVCKRRMRKVIFPSECNFLSFLFFFSFLYDRYWKELCESFYKFPFIFFSSLLSVICNSSSTSCQFFCIYFTLLLSFAAFKLVLWWEWVAAIE